MPPTNTVYLTSAAEYRKYKENLKLVPCPHCRTVGCLIGHGYIRLPVHPIFSLS